MRDPVSEFQRRLVESHVFLLVYNYLHVFPSTLDELVDKLPLSREIIENSVLDGESMGCIVERGGVYYAVPLPLVPLGVLGVLARVVSTGWRRQGEFVIK